MRKNVLKRILAGFSAFAGLLVLTAAIALTVLHARTRAILDDYASVYTDDRYRTPVLVEGVDVIRQEVSCGYAVLQMFSSWAGGSLTEKALYDHYGKVVTSTGRSFCDEMNRQFPQYTTTMHRYLKNTELIALVYENLSAGIPVPFEWAAKYGDEWTLHYSLIIGADIPGDRITVANPYGYDEEITVKELLERTSFEAYERMPMFLRLGFAFGVFEKNMVFEVR